MEYPVQVKEALKQLPPAERVVALALKNIYERIRSLHDKQDKQILANRSLFADRFKSIEDKASEVINGKIIGENDLANVDEYFVEEEKNQLKKYIGTSLPIKQYWLVALKNSQLVELMTPEDEKILAFLTNVSHKVNDTSLEISLTFKGSNIIKDGVYTRSCQLNNGIPVSFKGSSFGPDFKLSEGFLYDISRDTTVGAELEPAFQILSFFITDLVPYSLRYFLGEVENELLEQDFEDDEDDEQQGSQEEEDELEEKNGASGRKQKPGAKKQ